MAVYAVRDAVGRPENVQSLATPWFNGLKIHAAALPLAEFTGTIGNLRGARFGRDSAWRAMACFGALDEFRHAQIPLLLMHESVRWNSQFDWAHKFYHTNKGRGLSNHSGYDNNSHWKESHMKPAVVMLIALGCVSSALAQRTAPAPPASVGAAIDREISLVERQIVSAVEAMPEAKFNFSPESLDINGANFKGVYTFAGLVKHLAAANYYLWGGAGGDQIPAAITGIKGPGSMTSRAEIIQLLKDSFASGHHAAAALTTENSLDMVTGPGGNKVPRVFALTFAAVHAFDEYGQMEEYLRMNGIVPPASRAN